MDGSLIDVILVITRESDCRWVRFGGPRVRAGARHVECKLQRYYKGIYVSFYIPHSSPSFPIPFHEHKAFVVDEVSRLMAGSLKPCSLVKVRGKMLLFPRLPGLSPLKGWQDGDGSFRKLLEHNGTMEM